MALSKIRIFPIASYGSDGYPVYSAPVKPLTLAEGETEVNNIKISIQKVLKTKTLNADDKEEEHSSVVALDGKMTVYGADATFLSTILPSTKDSNGNLHFYAGVQETPKVGIFFEGKNEKGKKFQTWIYCAQFKPLNEELETEKDDTVEVELEFKGLVITAGGKERTHARVYEGNTGFVSGEPLYSSIYKEPVVSQ